MRKWWRRVIGSGAGVARLHGPPPWWRVLGFDSGPPRTLGAAEVRFRKLAATAHPDRGGSVDAMQRLNRARAEARRALTG